MDAKEHDRITDTNAEHVREWFAVSDFESKRLDGKKGNNNPKRCDWLFTKQDLSVLCEVKTIFSGAQSALTQVQYERGHANNQRPYVNQTIYKENAFNKFQADLESQLTNDAAINHLPLRIGIFIESMYVPNDEAQKIFINWLKNSILSMSQNSADIDAETTYEFKDKREKDDKEVEHSVKVHIFIESWLLDEPLRVDFTINADIPFYEFGVKRNICKAVKQLLDSVREAPPSSIIIPTVALWSESDYLRFQTLFRDFAIDGIMGKTSQRYYLLDYAFSKYPDLAAILLFWRDYGENAGTSKAIVITNPHLPDTEIKLKEAISENCMFITGIASDPLNPS